MKKFNLFKEIITTSTSGLKKAIENGDKFAINIKGEIRKEPFNEKDILIYHGTPDKLKPLEITLGNKYQVVVDKERVLIKAFGNWQELIAINTPQASYDDTTADGVDEFPTKEMEDIGWHAIEFNISYRKLVEILEQECEGILFCIEQENPFQFSGFGFLDDFDNARDILFAFCKNKIEYLLANDDEYDINDLTDDEKDTVKFFKIVI
ncbi:MAG: hypothetical protein L3J10_07200 [Sulfurimonas sp.]|nr:hypothetical protein [Sulfurimonas sp.]